MTLGGKIQADLVRELGWTKRKASEVFNGDQQYKRDMVNELSEWLSIEPFELLMRPIEASKLRELRQVAEAIVSTSAKAVDPALPSHIKKVASSPRSTATKEL